MPSVNWGKLADGGGALASILDGQFFSGSGTNQLTVYLVILYCVFVYVWAQWDACVSGKLMMPPGTKASLFSGSG